MSDKKHVGWCWIGNTLLPIYSRREITKGKNKGKFEVSYLNGWSRDANQFRYKSILVLQSDLQEKLGRSDAEKAKITEEKTALNTTFRK